jgi:hypothetical protein
MSVEHRKDSIVETARERQREADIKAAAALAFVALAENGQFADVTAAEHITLFEGWAYPVRYIAGQIREYEGKLYKCVTSHTSQADWTPSGAASLWSPTGDPADEWPDWSPPIGAHDSYSKGDKVSHEGSRWVSDTDNNVWEPGIYGWDEFEDPS